MLLGEFADEELLETSGAPLDSGAIAGIAIACLCMSVVIGLICISRGHKKQDSPKDEEGGNPVTPIFLASAGENK